MPPLNDGTSLIVVLRLNCYWTFWAKLIILLMTGKLLPLIVLFKSIKLLMLMVFSVSNGSVKWELKEF